MGGYLGTHHPVVFSQVCPALGDAHADRESREVRFREAFGRTLVWLAAAVLFDSGLYFWMGPRTATEFTAGCLIEFSLSIDNIFIIALLFSSTPLACYWIE